MDSEKLYDLSYMNQVTKGNTALLEKLCQAFITGASQGIATLETASQAGNIDLVQETSHTLKTTLATMNVREATALLILINKSARLKVNTEEIPAMVERAAVIIRDAVTQLKNDLQL